VQHLDCLDRRGEGGVQNLRRDPTDGDHQPGSAAAEHIDQAQSLNVSIDPSEVSVKEINQLYIEA